MNNKSILLACALSLGVASVASGAVERISVTGPTAERHRAGKPVPRQTYQYVYVTGSTAARSAFFNAVMNGSTVFDSAPTAVTQQGKTQPGATYMNFIGTLSGVSTIVKCHWSGSEAGLADLYNGTEESFLIDDATTVLSSAAPAAANLISSAVDICGADNNVVYSRSPGAAAFITGTETCIVPFKWEKELGSAASLANVTDQSLRAALAGIATLSLFSGNPTDTNFVYVTGRNNQSGTRVNAFGDTGYGIFSAPFQLEVATNGAMVVQVDGNILEDVGYSSGGSVAAQMGYSLDQSVNPAAVDIANGNGIEPYSVIAYLGIGDATTAEANGATPLTYNGVAYSVTAVEQGQYNFWGNEYLYILNTASPQAFTVYTKLGPDGGVSANADGVTEINLNDMQVVRNGPTSDPLPKF